MYLNILKKQCSGKTTLKDKQAKLIGDIVMKCVENNTSFILKNQKYVYIGKTKLSGYFLEDKEIKAICRTDFKKWFHTLVHESCHLDQYLDKRFPWKKTNMNLVVLDNWLSRKKPVAYSELFCAFKTAMSLELDCEKRTIKKLKKYNIPLDDYIQSANAYLFSYVYAFNTKKWYSMAYTKPKIIEGMPEKLLTINGYFKKFNKYSHLFQ